MGEAFSIYSGFFLQRLRNWCGGWRWDSFHSSGFSVFLHAGSCGAFLGHVAGFGGCAFLGFLLVFALVGGGGSNESK